MLLAHRTAVVAGIGPGLGRETALALARAGATVALVARSGTLLPGLKAEIEASGSRAIIAQGSITDPAFCADLAARLREDWGGVDVLVNNAFSSGVQSSAMDADLKDWRDVFEVNVFGTMHITRALVPLMARRPASIVMVNSDQAWRTVPGFAAYSASKAALVNITRALASELGEQGIRVNSFHPGLIMGPPVRAHFRRLAEQMGTTAQQVEDDVRNRAALRFIPDGRDLAGTILFLASDLSRPITGQSIAADGGQWFH